MSSFRPHSLSDYPYASPVNDSYLFYPKKIDPGFVICDKSPDGRHRFSPPDLQCNWCSIGGVIVGEEVLYVPTIKGVEYHLRTEPNVLIYGGRGSAKSTIVRWDAHMRALAHPGFKYVILRRTFPELDKTHLTEVPKEMIALGGDYNRTSHTAFYPNGSIGFYSHCATEEDVNKVILGASLGLLVADEVSTFEWEHFLKLASSVRAPVGAGYEPYARAATNPLGPSAMKVMQYFKDKDVDPEEDPHYNPNDWYAIQANALDNPYLPKSYIRRFSGLPEHIRKAWVDGEFALENALFNFRPRLDGKPYHVIHDLDLPKILKNATVYRAIDAGWFPDPTVCLWIAHLGNRHIVFHEETWYKTTAVDIAEKIKEIDQKLGVKRVAMTYCDPSMDINTTADIRTIKEIYEANGIPMENSINNREAFAMVIHNALAEEAYEHTPRLQIYAPGGHQGAFMLTRTIPQMRFDEKQPKKMADHKQDHWVVALAYYLLSYSANQQNPIPGTPTLPPWMKPSGKSDRFVLGSDQVRGNV